MTKQCSHCSNNGHNSRTCPNIGVKLFGVRLTVGSIKKSASTSNLNHNGSSITGSGSPLACNTPDHGPAADGYASEDVVQCLSSRRGKKGVPWTEDEHKRFIVGLNKLGKGDWRGISRNYVTSRTPTQVASHAQKYFIRKSNSFTIKRRSSLFDIVPEDAFQHPNIKPGPEVGDEEIDFRASTSNNGDPMSQNSHSLTCYQVLQPCYNSPFSLVVPNGPMKSTSREIFKPTAVHLKDPLNIQELIGISKLKLCGSMESEESSSFSLKLVDGSLRQSAFTASNPGQSSAHGV